MSNNKIVSRSNEGTITRTQSTPKAPAQKPISAAQHQAKTDKKAGEEENNSEFDYLNRQTLKDEVDAFG